MACINRLIKSALTCQKPAPRTAYIAPLFNQAKDVAWDYLQRYTSPIPGIEVNQAELRVDLPNGGRVRLYGGDNPDRLRGIYLDDAVLDEPADMHPRLWSEIVRPALADRQGSAAFIGTPKGHNEFYEIWKRAQGDPEWFALMLKASETGIIPAAELAAARKEMPAEQFQQEFECSFEAAVLGAYYGKEMAQAEADKRIGRVPWEPETPVHTAWDLGMDDATVIWFVQAVNKERRVIDYYEASGESLAHYVAHLKTKPYVYGDHLLPHDTEVKELGTGKSRVEVLRSLGLNPVVVPAQRVEDGINAVRMMLPQCWFDAEKCSKGIEALKQYQRDWDDKAKTWRAKPRHDWASHAADAFRYLALGLGRSLPGPKFQQPSTKWVV